MATITIPYTFTTGNTIEAGEHNANYSAIQVFVDSLASGGSFNAGALGSEDIANGAITTAKIAASVALTTPTIGVAVATSIAVSGNVVYHTTINPQIASYTLVLVDDGALLEINSATPVNLTVPPNSSIAFPVGTTINILQTGAGQITVVQGDGVTVNATPGLKVRTQWAVATLVKRATNIWVLVGDLAA